jgi:uncharacterized iron-regulated membrane protein
MNALLIVGLVGIAIWFERRRNATRRPVRQRPSDDALSHALQPRESPLR